MSDDGIKDKHRIGYNGFETFERKVNEGADATFRAIGSGVSTVAGAVGSAVSDTVMGIAGDVKEWGEVTPLEHQPAEMFGTLPTGSMYQKDFIPQTALPVDGSNSRLRKYSPFVIRIIPPTEIYAAGSTSTEMPVSTQTGLGSTAYDWDKVQTYGTPVLSQNSYGAFAGKVQMVIANGQLRGTTEGSVASTIQVADQILQIAHLKRLPPLVLLINPNSFQISYSKVQGNARTRRGYVFQEWGEGQPTISMSGRIGAFVSGNYGSDTFKEGGSGIFSTDIGEENAQWIRDTGAFVQETAKNMGKTGEGWENGPFLTDASSRLGKSASGIESTTPSGNREASRKYSASWHNFISLLQIYRNNGYIQNTLNNNLVTHMVGSIAIDYDGWTYVGHFNSLNYSFSEDKNRGGVEYDMEFTVSRMYDNTEPPSFIGMMTHSSMPPGSESPRSGFEARPNASWDNLSDSEQWKVKSDFHDADGNAISWDEYWDEYAAVDEQWEEEIQNSGYSSEGAGTSGFLKEVDEAYSFKKKK